MSSVIQNLMEVTLGDGARPTKFDTFINFNNTGLFGDEQDIVALVKTSQFPGKSHEVIDLKFKGRNIPIKGQVKFDNTWTCTFYLTQDHKLKTAFENWIESIDQVHNIPDVFDSVKAAQEQNSTSYVTQLSIAQMDFNGDQETTLYTLYNAFPKSVSSIDVDYSQVGSVMEFTVEFSYSHFDVFTAKTALGSYVDQMKAKARDTMSEQVGNLKKNIASLFKTKTGAQDIKPEVTAKSSDFSKGIKPTEMINPWK